jgi:tripeptide aminopeptidase
MNLIELFCKLVSIPSPSGKELRVAKFVKEYLTTMDITSHFDNSGKLNDSDSGNLIFRLKGNRIDKTILLVAHMDTVELGNVSVNPIVENGIVKSDGKTILGADDKASIAAILIALNEIKNLKKYPNIIVVFTTREEKGQMGSSLLNLPDRIDFAFNIDGSNNLGDFVYKTLGEIPFEIKIIGKAAHAAIEPEKGINAIQAAALLISKLSLGKNKENRILNIGTINGGKADNIVPDEVVLTGQIRAFTAKELNILLENIEQIIIKICKETNCSYIFTKKSKEGAPSFSIEENAEIISIAKKASQNLNLPFSLSKGSYSSDASYLSQKYSTLTICRGSQLPHSNQEYIKVEILEGLKNLLVEIIKVFNN